MQENHKPVKMQQRKSRSSIIIIDETKIATMKVTPATTIEQDVSESRSYPDGSPRNEQNHMMTHLQQPAPWTSSFSGGFCSVSLEGRVTLIIGTCVRRYCEKGAGDSDREEGSGSTGS